MPPLFPRCRHTLLLLAGCCLLSGCLVERFLWSPDGSHAAVITKAGLHLTDATGKLSPLLRPDVYRAAWLNDSHRLVVARSRTLKDFSSLGEALGPDATKKLTLRAEAFRANWKNWWQSDQSPENEPVPGKSDEAFAFILYLRDRYPDELKKLYLERFTAEESPEKAAAEWAEVEKATVKWHTLEVVTMAEGRLDVGAKLAEGLGEFTAVRPSPDGKAVAFIQAESQVDSPRIMLSPIDGANPPDKIAEKAALNFSWSHDSRSVYYLTSPHPQEGGVGTLNAIEGIEPHRNPDSTHIDRRIVDLSFDETNRVFALRDGRLLFNGATVSLPRPVKVAKQSHDLFIYDPQKDAVTRLFLPNEIAEMPLENSGFELSPDENQILIASSEGKIWLLTLDSQKAEQIYEGFKSETGQNSTYLAPAWRGPNEFTYWKKTAKRAEVVLRRGAQETVLSESWSDELLQELTFRPDPSLHGD